jgi:site-specific DNA recombinase
MKRYAIYRRVSTEEQARPGHVSLDAQLAECTQHVLRNGGVVAVSELDVLSGLKTTREGYQRIKESIRRHDVDVVLALDFSRWGRNAAESIASFQELRSLGVPLETVRQTTQDPFLQNLHAILAYRDSQEISAKTVVGLRYRAARGEWSGAPPVGYKVRRKDGVSKLAFDENAPMVRRLFREAAAGAHSLAQLSEMAKEWGLRGRSGHYLSRQALGKILRNPSYRGAVVYGRKSASEFKLRGKQPESEWIITEDAHPALVDPATFEAVQTALSRNRVDQGTVRRSKHLLTSLVYCGLCEGVAGPDGKSRAWRMYGHGSKTPVYECSRRTMYGECSTYIRADVLEAAIKDAVLTEFSIPDEVRQSATAYIQSEIEEQRSAVDHQRGNLMRELQKHQAARLDLARQRLGMAGAVIPEDVYQEMELQEAQAVSTLERELTSLPKEMNVSNVAPILDMVGSITWNEFSPEGWRQLLTLLIDRIVVSGQGQYEIQWEQGADVARRAVAKVSRFGSET